MVCAGPPNDNFTGMAYRVCGARRLQSCHNWSIESAETQVNKAFVKEGEGQDDDEELSPSLRLPPGSKNYMTRRGYDALRTELDQLVRVERPKLVETVAWAAGNGDRSENGDYIYGKKRLREIDRRIRFLIKRIESAEVVDPERQENVDQVFFGATVTITDADGEDEQTWQIVGVDEANASEGRISWISPLARALLKVKLGETVRFMSPAGPREIEVVDIRYV
ncbi:putative transcription elongation factor [Azoarcus olearius]|uniref:Transcription elongation factor GreB n=1 Tax=Azoarcus sp. (strain BH72) TaxID=418699 RepID=A1K5D6_AZOSB|nr:putative transcription elongation factor [Azoarcus olearius]